MITRDAHGTFEPNPEIIGVTDCNAYFPFYAALSHRNNRRYVNNYGPEISEQIVRDIFSYHKPYLKPEKINRRPNGSQYSDMFMFMDGLDVATYGFKFEEETHLVVCCKGYLADVDDNILLLLCSNSMELFRDERNTELKSENLRLYVSSELIINEKYKNLYKKIHTEYINSCCELDIEVIYTTSKKIENSTFDNGFKIEYKNLTELDEHLKSRVGENLFYVDDIRQPVQEEELSEYPGVHRDNIRVNMGESYSSQIATYMDAIGVQAIDPSVLRSTSDTISPEEAFQSVERANTINESEIIEEEDSVAEDSGEDEPLPF